MEGYKYIETLKKMEYEDWAMETIRRVEKDWHSWTKNIKVLYSARQKLEATIEQLIILI